MNFSDSSDADYRYHLLRAASERFQTAPGALDAQQRSVAERQARQTLALENLALASPEARAIVVPAQRLAASILEIRERYPNPDSFLADLTANGLDPFSLRQALRRELVFDGVMRAVGERAEAVGETDERRFYALHRDRFAIPERRIARHLLITVNEDFPENRRPAALARIQEIAVALKGCVPQFGKLARQFSECPTATQEGHLGAVARGQLYPTLDAALFALEEGRMSDAVESELGFHLLLCERIQPAAHIEFAQARAKIHAALDAQRRRDAQQRWLAELRQTAPCPQERQLPDDNCPSSH